MTSFSLKNILKFIFHFKGQPFWILYECFAAGKALRKSIEVTGQFGASFSQNTISMLMVFCTGRCGTARYGTTRWDTTL